MVETTRPGTRAAVAAIFVAINLIVDLLYALIDPRIRVEARGA